MHCRLVVSKAAHFLYVSGKDVRKTGLPKDSRLRLPLATARESMASDSGQKWKLIKSISLNKQELRKRAFHSCWPLENPKADRKERHLEKMFCAFPIIHTTESLSHHRQGTGIEQISQSADARGQVIVFYAI
jgi:hypothetical protein